MWSGCTLTFVRYIACAKNQDKSKMSKNDTTAILLNWKRSKNLNLIIESLNASGIVSEIIIWNNNPDEFMTFPRCTIINSSKNFKAYARFSAAMLASEKNIIVQDDDLLFDSQDIKLLHASLLSNSNRIYGFKGRNIENGKYLPVDAFGEVDIVLGQFMIFTKELLASVYGEILKLSPFDRGDDIAFSLLTNVKHICKPVERKFLDGDEYSLWREPKHYDKRQEMVDRVLSINTKNDFVARAESDIVEEQI